MNKANLERYTSFNNIACDANAYKLVQLLETHICQANGEERWQLYFKEKRNQQVLLKQDDLNFIGHQTNTLYEYFSSCEDQQALDLLYQIEQECC